MPDINIAIKKLRPDAVIPRYMKTGDAGFDLHCCENTNVAAGKTAILPTGLAFAIPENYEMQIRMRSGYALHGSLIIPNAPGTIDSGYRGEVGIIVRNLGPDDILVTKGERIAQGVLCPVAHGLFHETDNLPESSRGDGGFGSTGYNLV